MPESRSSRWSPRCRSCRRLRRAAKTSLGHRGGPEIVSGPAAQFYGYATPAMVVEKGGSLAYTNLDLVQHDVVHDVGTDGVSRKKRAPWCKRFDKGQCPIFWSNRAGLGSTVKVKGLNGVKPGEIYTFLCTLHPGMKGQLVVAP